ncbi:hypothetical protein NRY95_07535 [Xanthomonas campestris pv. phormiicola]|nr:hypothetical protein [Xanthomonas campestris pv. phormiicola]UYC18681.1 hypothetical protein NRY95_07535 [Xanthomonas campestris pv. phormiicola]
MPTRVASGLSVCLNRLFDTGLQRLAPELCHCRDCDMAKATRVLGWSPRPVRDGLIDTAGSLMLAGQVSGFRRHRCLAPDAGSVAASTAYVLYYTPLRKPNQHGYGGSG